MIMVTKDEFEARLKQLKNAIPDGFSLVGSMIQTKWLLDGKEVARKSVDGFGTIYEIVL
jgi:hypothetical protein